MTEQELEAQFPLGMFEGTDYEEQRFDLRRGDRLFVVSDGVIEATAASRCATARRRWTGSCGGPRPMAPLQAVRSLLGDLRAFVGTATWSTTRWWSAWTGPARSREPANPGHRPAGQYAPRPCSTAPKVFQRMVRSAASDQFST